MNTEKIKALVTMVAVVVALPIASMSQPEITIESAATTKPEISTLSVADLSVGVPAVVSRHVFSSGGETGFSTEYRLDATIGETITGFTAGTNLTLSQGFWQKLSGSCCALRADINHDGIGPDIADLIYFVSYVFRGGPVPECGSELDVNGDGRPIPDISDIVYLVSYMFGGGVAPVPCTG